MEKEFIGYTEALELKELGFDEHCLLKIQYSSGTDISGRKYQNSIWLGNGYEAEINDKKIKYKFPKHSEQCYGTLGIPTFSQAFRWFREKYGLYADIYRNGVKFNACIEDLITGSSKETVTDNGVEYEEAELECLKKLIEICKK
jgi:hypothetical protein